MNVHDYYFDWDRADCDMLLSDKTENRGAIKKVLDLEEFASSAGYHRCKELGVKKASAKEVMELLKSPDNKELYDTLRRTLKITKNLKFAEVEWKATGGTEKNPLFDWAVRDGVDLRGIKAIVKEATVDDTGETVG